MHLDLPRPGDLVWIRQRRWRVERARRERGVVRLDVACRGDRLTFLAPFDRPAIAGDAEALRRVRPQSARARLAHLVAHAFGQRTLPGMVRARIDVLPHQLEPALAVLHGTRRILIADEVGLGKTIQAGIVVAETIARAPAARVLVCAPGALRDQWARELADRFGIESVPACRPTIDRLAREGSFGENPWHRGGVWLASLDFLKQRHVMDGLPLEPWDLLILDEAHEACGDSDRHAAADELARRSRRVLLLTATPHSGDEAQFRRLLGLGRLDGCADAPTVFRRTRAGLHLIRRRSVRWHRVELRPAEARTLALLMSYEANVLRAAGARRQDAALLLLSVLRKRALSTMAAFVASLRRRLLWLDGAADTVAEWTQPTLAFDGGEDAPEDDNRRDAAGLTIDVGLDAELERPTLQRLLAAATNAARHESKVERLARLLARTGEPAVVFTEFRDSLQVLSTRLQGVRTVASLHGGMNEAERSKALHAFLRGAATVLAATDVAGQGLNLQSRARWVISLELPWNPARLEQRVGRVDRIGQRRAVHLTLVLARGDAESGLLARVARRVLAARHALGGDLLTAAAPGEAQLRTALLVGRTIAAPPPAPVVPLCRRWRRAARVAARRLVRARALDAYWRGPAPVGAVWSRRAPIARGAALLIFRVPLVTADEEIVEQHVVAVRVPGLSPAAPIDLRTTAVEAARAGAARRLRARAARLTRVRTTTAGFDERVERALARDLLETRVPHEVQSRLFDRRGERLFASARSRRESISSLADERSGTAQAAAAVRIGRPTLAMAFFAP